MTVGDTVASVVDVGAIQEAATSCSQARVWPPRGAGQTLGEALFPGRRDRQLKTQVLAKKPTQFGRTAEEQNFTVQAGPPPSGRCLGHRVQVPGSELPVPTLTNVRPWISRA